MADRARITIADIVLLVFGLAVLVGLYPVFRGFLEDAAPDLDPMTLVVFQVVVPLAVVVVVAMLSAKALRGTS